MPAQLIPLEVPNVFVQLAGVETVLSQVAISEAPGGFPGEPALFQLAPCSRVVLLSSLKTCCAWRAGTSVNGTIRPDRICLRGFIAPAFNLDGLGNTGTDNVQHEVMSFDIITLFGWEFARLIRRNLFAVLGQPHPVQR